MNGAIPHRYGVVLTLFLKDGSILACCFDVTANSSEEAIQEAKKGADKMPQVESSCFLSGVPGSLVDYGVI